MEYNNNYCGNPCKPLFYVPYSECKYRYDGYLPHPNDHVRSIRYGPCKEILYLPLPGNPPRGVQCPMVIPPKCCPPLKPKCIPCEKIYH